MPPSSPSIFDNIEQALLPALRNTLERSERSDFCVGYFNLRGWRQIDSFVDRWEGGEGKCCRLLVGMQRMPQDVLRREMNPLATEETMDNQTALRLKKRLAAEFREQLSIGTPTNEDEAGLRRLAAQIRAKKVVVKLFLRHPLHAKLYLLFRPDPINPTVGYLGSSNLTLPGLSRQGELNIDVTDHDACRKLADWFEARWTDRWCIDISDELVKIIDQSWARGTLIPPFHIYIKMAYHLSQEAQTGLREFKIPADFGDRLFKFQEAAVLMAAQKLNKRGGVIIGDVVGLGKTLMATALARVFEDDHGLETLILCPKNLVPMWEDYAHRYRMRGAKVMSITKMTPNAASELRRYRQVIIDESHNLRNREGRRYRIIQDYLRRNDCQVILLSATPYNKSYQDLSSQLRLFVEEDADIGMRPEKLLRDMGLIEFKRQHQCPERSLSAFEKSHFPDDWRELMRLYLVRRTRGFIADNYGKVDEKSGRKYLEMSDGGRSYFPERVPKTVKFNVDDANPSDQYARLYAPAVVDAINHLDVPRYGLGLYLPPEPAGDQVPADGEADALDNLSRAGKRLMGFCRTNLFKRLESSGHAFIQSVQRHILRNFIYLHALENNLPLPIGTQDFGLLDAEVDDEDAEIFATTEAENGDDQNIPARSAELPPLITEDEYRRRAAAAYAEYADQHTRRFNWLRSDLFEPRLAEHLISDNQKLMELLKRCGSWDPSRDQKLNELEQLLKKTHKGEKVIVFSQFADTVRYLERQLAARGITQCKGVTGDTPNPTEMAHRFSPVSNEKRDAVRPESELRVLIATDVLSEGQNLQDGAVLVNFDLPWAIIRLIQRAGRVDRIGQKAEKILCYSFLPADGVESIIRLRARVAQRLKENAEVIGTDEQFLEDGLSAQKLRDLFTEKSGSLNGDDDKEVDLESEAYQIWKNATDADAELAKTVREMPDVVYSTRDCRMEIGRAEGVLTYMRTAEVMDYLAWINRLGATVTESQIEILRAAKCEPDTPAIPRHEKHHELVASAVKLAAAEASAPGGQLGGHRSARFRVYERLEEYARNAKGTLYGAEFLPTLAKAIEEIYKYPLRPLAVEILNRQLRSGIGDEELVSLVISLRDEGRLCKADDEEQTGQDGAQPQIICSMGLFKETQGS